MRKTARHQHGQFRSKPPVESYKKSWRQLPSPEEGGGKKINIPTRTAEPGLLEELPGTWPVGVDLPLMSC